MKTLNSQIDVTCQYCGNLAFLVNGGTIYPRRTDLRKLLFWVCPDKSHSRAYVGCHKGTEVPLGELADSKTREMRGKAHRCFDPIWKDGHMTRSQAYKWLASTLKIEPSKCHIGSFNPDMCQAVMDACTHKKAVIDMMGPDFTGKAKRAYH